MNHFKLFNKLIDRCVPKKYVNLIKNWYGNQNVFVKFNNKFSEQWKIKNGVRQGGVLSPYLFNVYIDDLIKNVSKISSGCRLGIFSSNIIAYADDLCLLSPSIKGLQNLIDVLHMNIKDLNLNLNTDKSMCIKFAKNGAPFLNNNGIKINDTFLKFEKETKYLGYCIQYNMIIKNDVNREKSKFYKQFNSMLRKFNSSDISVKLRLFNTYCLQLYGSSFWTNDYKCKVILKQFAVAYHKAIKRILNVSYGESNHFVCSLTGLYTFNHFINVNIFRSLNRFLKKPCSFVSKNMSFLKHHSVMLKQTNNILRSVYSVHSCFLENDFNAILSRIDFVFNTECIF